MDVFNLAAKLTLDSSDYDSGLGNAESRFSMFGEILKGNLATEAITKGLELVTSAAQKAAEGLYNLVKDSVMAYADYEQLVGGVQKLYGNMGLSVEEYAAQQGKSVAEVQDEWQKLETAQNLVMENAQNAYKTSGMSMNEYMESATSFSASLINSLGGDTVEAANLTDVAMQNIADNFNTFGGDIGMIQGAFQGFAKQNYTMLDNLKLGYGGTKEEMERLIADANEYAATIGESSDLSIDSFADVVRAIDLVQRKQQIRGTTAREAEKTVQGSIGMTKAAYKDLLTAIGGGGDVDQAFDNFISSFQNTVDNIIPVIERIIPAIGQIIEKIAPLVEEYLPVLIEEVSPLIMDAITIIGGALLDLLGELLPKLGQFLLEKLAELWEWLKETFPVIQKVEEVFTTIVEVITTVFQTIAVIFATTWEVIKIVWDTVSPYFQAIWEAIKGVFSVAEDTLGGFFSAAWETIKFVWDVVSGYFETIWETIKGIFSVVESILTGDFEGAWEGIKGIIDLWGGYFSDVWESIKEVFSPVIDWFREKFEDAWEAIKEVFQPVIDFFQGIWDDITGVFDGIGEEISGFFDWDWYGIGSNIISGIANGVTSAGRWLWDAIYGAVSNAWNNLLAWLGIASPSKKARDQIGKMWSRGIGVGFVENMPIDDMVGAVSDAFDAVEDVGVPGFDYDDVNVSSLDVGTNNLGMNSDGGVVINVYATERQDEEEIAREVQRVFIQWENQRKAAYA